jgi:hypothetical protein
VLHDGVGLEPGGADGVRGKSCVESRRLRTIPRRLKPWSILGGLSARLNGLVKNAFTGHEIEQGLKPKRFIVNTLRHD